MIKAKKNIAPKINPATTPNQQTILEGSRAIALTIKMIKPDVVSAYPITPQTHIVEDLAQFKADGEANFEYVRAESEFAAASIALGASAAGARVYTATSSQGLLLMTEVVFNIAGMRLPIVMTLANRGVSAPITIWNDHQDAMTVRDAGWIMLFAENHQEAVEQHLLAYKIAEQVRIPVMVNIDGFVLTHTYEPVTLPTQAEVKKFLPDYKPGKGEFLDPKNPATFGGFATPAHYMEIRQDLYNDLIASGKLINEEYENLQKAIPSIIKPREKATVRNTGSIEYYGPTNPKVILIAMGSVVGTIKDVVDKSKGRVGVLKIKSFRPFPRNEVLEIIKKAKYNAVIEKSVSLGATDSPLAMEVKATAKNKTTNKVQSFVVGLGGRDITETMIESIIVEVQKKDDGIVFVGK